MNENSTGPSEQRGEAPVPRPERFLDLPLDVRWKVTRRHPVYLLSWDSAQLYHDGAGASDEAMQSILHQHAVMLNIIGVHGRPVHPATPVEEVMSGGGLVWHGAAVRPVPMRALCVLLMSALAKEDRLRVADLLKKSALPEHAVPDDSDGEMQKRLTIAELARLPSPGLDAIPSAPYFYVHLNAADRSIEREIIDHVRRYRNVPREDRRLRLDKIPGQLQVWDLREGWQGEGYELAREQKFADVARELQLSVSTAIDRYKAAFELILGVPFSRESWWEQFGRRKYGMAGLEGRNEAGRPRWRHSPSPQPIPETRFRSPGEIDTGEGIATGSSVAAESEFSETLLDLESLFATNRSDAEIADALAFHDEQREQLVAALRARYQEFGELL